MTVRWTRTGALGLVAASLLACAESGPAAIASPAAPVSAVSAAACQVREPVCGGAVPGYDTDVLPILRARCFKCHANGGVAADDHDFSRPETTRAQRMSLAGEIAACAMPPSGEPALSATEASVLLAWSSCKLRNDPGRSAQLSAVPPARAGK